MFSQNRGVIALVGIFLYVGTAHPPHPQSIGGVFHVLNLMVVPQQMSKFQRCTQARQIHAVFAGRDTPGAHQTRDTVQAQHPRGGFRSHGVFGVFGTGRGHVQLFLGDVQQLSNFLHQHRTPLCWTLLGWSACANGTIPS